MGIVARSMAKKAEVEADFPGLPVYESLGELLTAGVDAVTITTPPHTRHDLVMEAIEAGALTLANVLASGELGETWRVHSTMDQDNADSLEQGASGGLLRDLGSHLVDQMLWLLGPVGHVYATLDWTDRFGEHTDCGFVVTMTHASGVVSAVSASKLNHSATRELRAYGSKGSYAASGADVQAEALMAGRHPVEEPDIWRIDAPKNWGILSTNGHRETVPSAQGNYADFYTAFARAVRGDGPEPVPAAEGIHTLEVLDAARQSALENSVIAL